MFSFSWMSYCVRFHRVSSTFTVSVFVFILWNLLYVLNLTEDVMLKTGYFLVKKIILILPFFLTVIFSYSVKEFDFYTIE